jgi:hypothetical protein
MGVQALRPEGPVEGFHIGVSVGFPGREKPIFAPF